jgi:hypothetical protein
MLPKIVKPSYDPTTHSRYDIYDIIIYLLYVAGELTGRARLGRILYLISRDPDVRLDLNSPDDYKIRRAIDVLVLTRQIKIDMKPVDPEGVAYVPIYRLTSSGLARAKLLDRVLEERVKTSIRGRVESYAKADESELGREISKLFMIGKSQVES